MKQITTLYVRGRQFYIVQNEDGFYLAIEDKYVDHRGRLTQKLNGLQTHAAKNLKNCIETTQLVVEVDYLESQGMPRKEAMKTVLNAYTCADFGIAHEDLQAITDDRFDK